MIDKLASILKPLAEIAKSLFGFLKWCATEKGWKPTLMMFVMIILMLGSSSALIYFQFIKMSAIDHSRPKLVIEKPIEDKEFPRRYLDKNFHFEEIKASNINKQEN